MARFLRSLRFDARTVRRSFSLWGDHAVLGCAVQLRLEEGYWSWSRIIDAVRGPNGSGVRSVFDSPVPDQRGCCAVDVSPRTETGRGVHLLDSRTGDGDPSGGGGGGGGTPIIQLCNALQAIAGQRSTSACRDERGRQPVGMAQVPTGRSGKRRRAREGCFGFSSAVPVHNGSRKSRRPSGAALGRNGQLHSPSLAGPLPRFAAPHFVLFSACSLALARLELMMLGI